MPGRLDRHVGAGADGDADVGRGQRRRVVHPVADHRHDLAAALPGSARPRRPCPPAAPGPRPRRCRGAATESATAWLSPVIIATRTPSAWSARDRLVGSGRISSSSASAPTMRPSATTWRTVRPSRAHASVSASGSGPQVGQQARAADRDASGRRPSPGPRARPGSRTGGAGHSRPAARPRRRSPGRGGARESASTAAARPRTRPRPARRRSPRPRGSPWVSVPVLSKITTSSSRAAPGRGGS